jgi:carboxyl-terminal processing protease
MSSFFKKAGPIIVAVAIIGLSFGVGMYVGSERTMAEAVPAGISNSSAGEVQDVDFSLFWKAWDILNEKFAPTAKHPNISDQDKLYGAIKGLADSYGDPYTTFFPPADNSDFQAQISGNFGGIGIELGTDSAGDLTVIAPLKGSPADKAGVKAGDQILKIDATSTADISVDDAVDFMRGPTGSTVSLTLQGPNDKTSRVVTITRAVINIPEIDNEDLGHGIYVIRLYTFTADSADLFRTALKAFVQSGDTKLIIDLRGNPGGYLDSAVDIASWFLPSKDLVVQEKDATGTITPYYSKGYNIFNGDLKMVVLADGGSASASEILSGALQQNGAAKLVGTQTFGKGSVQELVPLTADTSLKITVAQWLTPNGSSISDHGLTPDVVVPETQADTDKGIDDQQNKAISILEAE